MVHLPISPSKNSTKHHLNVFRAGRGKVVGGYNVEFADCAKEEAHGKDDGEISESRANYGYERNVGESFGFRGVALCSHIFLI